MYIADLHIHSKYSRATSGACVPEQLELWGRRKGIDLIGTGDFTHPAWRALLREKLIPTGDGLYRLRDDCRIADDTAGDARPRFVVTGEISSIYKKDGRVRKVHNVFLLPSLEAADEFAHRLEAVGNVHSDGRPILGVDSRDLFELALDACPQAILIPAHIWTPHFSLFGAFSGFDTIEACYGDLTPYIHALETGLSSDPPMNWRLSALDGYRLVSNSDAHSPAKLGREANLFDTDLSYPALSAALESGEGLMGTIEFFPEEGKYHLDGHRGCGLRLTPEQTRQAGGVCPVCGKKITIGVLNRVEQLADRPEGYRPANAAPFESLVPLAEVIAASTGYTAASARVLAQYDALLREVGNEFYILREAPAGDIERVAGPCVAEGIRRMRSGRIELAPGFDGEYGKIRLLDDNEIESLSGQLCLFGIIPKKKKRAPKSSHSAAAAAPKKERTPASGAQGALYGLNEEQRFAASASEPAVAVVAGPGTGKTKTLISRIAWLVEQCGVSPAEITAVTFTNKAAGEMRQRLELLFGGREPAVPVRMLTVGTFHAICLRLLEEAGMAAPIIDEFEARSVAEEVLSGLDLRLSARRLLESASRAKNGFGDDGGVPPEALRRYNDRLRALGVLDYDDILLRALELFERPDASPPRDRFTHLLVDELQDINDVQYRLIRAWGRGSAGVFVIGDPDQSIYGFRGANARCFERFLADCEGARLVRLTRNYRSTPEILSCALSVLPRSGERELLAQRDGGARVALLEPRDELAEGIFIAKEIGRLVGGIDMLDADAQQPRGDGAAVGFSDIAVLYRTHRQAEILEMCLRRESIPYVVAGRDKLLADDLVRGAAGFFRNLLDPDDAVSLRTCLKRVFGCAEDVIRRLSECHGEMERDALVRSDLGLRRWAELAEKYAPRLSAEKPRALLEEWAADCGYTQSPALDKLLNMAVFDDRMAGFLTNLALGQEGDVARSGNRAYSADTVSLMTLHGAKGLEFPVVFLCGVRSGVIPLNSPGRFADPEEERRLLYVGMTRAQSELFVLSGAEPSPFLSSLPEQCVRRDDAGATAQAAWRGKQLSLFD